MEVFRSPYRGCCGKWVEHLRQNGFQVTTHDVSEVLAARKQMGMPDKPVVRFLRVLAKTGRFTSMLTMLNLPARCRLHGAAAPAVRRIAAPMVGGMISSTILTLIVIPAIYALVKEFTLRRKDVRADRAGEREGAD